MDLETNHGVSRLPAILPSALKEKLLPLLMTTLVPSHYEDDPWLVADDHLRGRFMAGWGWSVPSHCEEMIHGQSGMVTCDFCTHSPKANLNTGPRKGHVANHAGGRRVVVWECYHQRTQEATHHGCMDQPRKSILAIHLWRGFMTDKPIDLGVHFPVKQMFIADNTKTMIGTMRLWPRMSWRLLLWRRWRPFTRRGDVPGDEKS
ncbi:uncharacterized protein [Aegilops tauschii subsp. strangulata]|uniref:uncharacterized protein isoform X2 n=2 Tax=Aegilops tauschii subsp. strangulata TaxID=200361 RepID=UPI001ABC376D|nr:uncharacterized protein LOC109786679 isoform X6 [Aegilops tauschii subsp. strangulata]